MRQRGEHIGSFASDVFELEEYEEVEKILILVFGIWLSHGLFLF